MCKYTVGDMIYHSSDPDDKFLIVEHRVINESLLWPNDELPHIYRVLRLSDGIIYTYPETTIERFSDGES